MPGENVPQSNFQYLCKIYLKKIYLALVLLFFLFRPAFSQISDAKTHFYHVNTTTGLQSDIVHAIIQDYRGLIWFGTGNGLFNFDGHAIKTYLSDASDSTSLSGNMVQSFLIDNKNNFWIGTNFGLCTFNAQNNNFKRIRSSVTFNQRNSIIDIKQHVDNQIIACAPANILLFNQQTGVVDEFIYIKNIADTKDNERFNRLFIDQDNRLWACTQFRFIIFDWPEKQHTLIDHQCGFIRNVFQSDPKHVWICSSNGLFVLNLQTRVLKKFVVENSNFQPSSEIWDAKIDHLGNLWIGTNQMGLIRYNLEKQTVALFSYNEFNPHGLGNNNIRSIYTDRQGIVWVGTQYKGVSYAYIENPKKFNTLNNEPGTKKALTSNIISSIIEDSEGNLWLGTDGYGLNKIMQHTGDVVHFVKTQGIVQGITTNGILALLEDKEKNIWIGGYRGFITKYNLVTGKWKQYPNCIVNNGIPVALDIRKFFLDAIGKLWIATNGHGIFLYNRETDDFKNFNTSNSGLIDDYTLTITEDNTHKLWIGTYYGACIFNPASPNEKIHFWTDPKDTTSISNNWVYCSYRDKAGNIWLGTAFGLNLYLPKTNAFKRFNNANQIPGKEIYGIIEDDANDALWISTNNGLTRFNPLKNTFKNYFQDDGLPSNIFIKGSFFKNKDNKFYFGTSDGLVSFVPYEIKTDTFTPAIIITDIQVFFKTILDKNNVKTDFLKFNHHQSTITIKFIGLNYILNNRNTYLYKLDGYDKTWNNVQDRREATFTNLDPGKYKFRVKVFNRDGFTNNQEATISFSILPPWWKTYWFQFMVSIFLLGLLFLILRLRTFRIQKQKLYLENIVQLRTHELTNKNKELFDKANELNRANELLLDRQLKIENQSKEILDVNKELNVTNSMKDKVFSIIAHDLKNPFTTILGFAELLKKSHHEITPESRNEQISILYNSCKKVYDLLDNLLIWGLSQMKKIECHPAPFNLTLLITDNISFTNEVCENKNIVITLHNHSIFMAFADYNMINTVVRNLINNAVKFTPKNGKIDMYLSENEEYISCAIKDTGVGIQPELLKQLFKIEKTITTHGTFGESGTGLGLIICHDFITRNGGKIWAESAINSGTSFYFSIPRAKPSI